MLRSPKMWTATLLETLIVRLQSSDAMVAFIECVTAYEATPLCLLTRIGRARRSRCDLPQAAIAHYADSRCMQFPTASFHVLALCAEWAGKRSTRMFCAF